MSESESAEKPGLPPDALELANAESMAYVAWCQQQIAESFYVVQLPPKPWAGRDDLINAASRNFDNPDLLVMSNAVDQAVLGMWNRQKEDPYNFQKQAMLLRAQGIRQLILQAIKNGRKESTYQYKPLKNDGTKLVETKVKEKRYVGTDMAAVDKLLAVERLIAELQGLYGDPQKTGGDIVERFFQGLDDLQKNKIAAVEDQDGVTSSRALKAKNRAMDGKISPANHRLLESIITQNAPEDGKAEPVSATVVARPRGKVIEAGGVSFIDDEAEEDDEK